MVDIDGFGSIDDVLDFAIGEEEAARAFYETLASQASSASMREVFEGFAREEKGHKAKLEAIKAGEPRVGFASGVQDLRIGDYLVDVEAGAGTSYQEALIVAMKKEKAAFRLYSDLAAIAPNEELRQTFLGLAQEEARHKLRFEIEYDENVLTDN
jgi:rubrerythrin